MKINNFFPVIFFLLLAAVLPACKKQLDAKPNKQLVTPQSLADLQSIMDYSPFMIADPGSDESSADNYFISDADYNALALEANRRIYSWQPDNFFDGPASDWGIAYRKIYYCNTALDVLPTIAVTTDNEAQWQDIKGQALFKRSKTFWHIVNMWALAYDPATAATDIGIPLRLNADFSIPSVRATVKQSYERILMDMKEAIPMLPKTPFQKTRGSKAAAYGFLSRVYLSMRDYPNAKLYADSSLALFNTLLDYNTLNAGATFPFAQSNAETIFYSVAGELLIDPHYGKIDTLLYSMYDSSDLRKVLFFKMNPTGYVNFKGSYSNSDSHFSGIATDEVYLTRAECYARDGKLTEALADLNTLLIKRYKTGTFVPVMATDANDALAKILTERRKELLMRFTRWMDIKRLNKEGAGITLKRFINGKVYTLMPNDLRYALPLPEDVLAISGMQQNPR